MELGNLFFDVKEETQVLRANASVRVPMRRTGAELFVVVLKLL